MTSTRYATGNAHVGQVMCQEKKGSGRRWWGIQKDEVGRQERNCLHRAMRIGDWIANVHHCLNITELS